MVNVQKIKQKRFNAFKQGHLNNIIGKHFKLSHREVGDIIYEDVLLDEVPIAYFEYKNGTATFVELEPCVAEKVV